MITSPPIIQRRSLCPLSGATGAQVLQLPYTLPPLAHAAQRLSPQQRQTLHYTLFYNSKLDFYWQETLVEEQTAVEGPGQQYRTPDLPRFTHATEEAILFRLLLKHVQIPKVFDFGMGEGWWLRMMLAYGMEGHGFDTWPHALGICQKYGLTHAPLESYPDNFFDIINAQEVFEHLPNPMAAAQLVSQKLKPGGLAKLSTPGDKKIKLKIENLKKGNYTTPQAFDKDFDSIYPFQHINLFSATSMRYMLQKAGLKPARISAGKYFQATTGLYSMRQLNRALYNPLKRHSAKGTVQLFTK